MSNQRRSVLRWDRTDWLILLSVTIPIVLYLFFYQELPEQMAVHFGIDGEPNRYQGKLSFLITIGLLLIIIPIVLKVSSLLDPQKANYAKFERAFNLFRLTVALLLSVSFIFVILTNLGYAINIQLIVLLGIGLLFLVTGNYLGQIRPNFFFGIRTPWTLANQEVWRRTHRLGGPVMMISGLILIIAAFLPGVWAVWLSGLSIVFFALVPTIYSYFLYSKMKK